MSGFLIVGGTTAEFWSASHSCSLPPPTSLSSYLLEYLTVDTVEGYAVACMEGTCERLSAFGFWQLLAGTQEPRKDHTSAVFEGNIYLVGGESSPSTTEVIDIDTGESARGFDLTLPAGFPGRQGHCSIQIQSDIILTGGRGLGPYDSLDYVTKYSLTDGAATEMPPLIKGRKHHACGSYSSGGKEVRDPHVHS